MRRTAVRTALPLATVSLVLTGIGVASPTSASVPTTAAGELTRYAGLVGTPPVVEVLPEGAWARVRAVQTGSGKTVVTLQVRGLRADEEYGAHAHYRPCGSTGAAAGAHYQNVEQRPGDEVTPSTDAAFANPANEVWLDFTTDGEGNGSAQTVVDWQFRPATAGRSVVVHALHTGPPGGAGARLGCLTVPF